MLFGAPRHGLNAGPPVALRWAEKRVRIPRRWAGIRYGRVDTDAQLSVADDHLVMAMAGDGRGLDAVFRPNLARFQFST
jgi:hypothetical protein